MDRTDGLSLPHRAFARRGRDGRIYLAEDTKLGPQVALKVLASDARRAAPRLRPKPDHLLLLGCERHRRALLLVIGHEVKRSTIGR